MDGSLIIDNEEAENFQPIFGLYLQGKSVIGIITELERLKLNLQQEKENWSKRTIDVMLSNEKYIGIVRLINSWKNEVNYVSEFNNPPIIIDEKFQAVQIEKANRSNVVKDNNGSWRKIEKYSPKAR
ncbi:MULTISPECIES: recombinase family protein [unclassified Clostridium]|uniref:recombinase family protein n=1 Tax=unclassified Clostridium TaxID=2614128 RepID=UPI00338E231F